MPKSGFESGVSSREAKVKSLRDNAKKPRPFKIDGRRKKAAMLEDMYQYLRDARHYWWTRKDNPYRYCEMTRAAGKKAAFAIAEDMLYNILKKGKD